MKTIFTILTLACGIAAAGTSERARAISRTYDEAYAKWVQDVRTAPDNAAQNAAWLRMPDAEEAGRGVWEQIKDELDQAWTLEPASWLLTNASGFAVDIEPGRRRGANGELPRRSSIIREMVERNHLQSPKLAPYCIALTSIEDPKAMRLLEVIEKSNPSPAVSGASALAQAVLHRRLGGGKRGMGIRQEKLRIAIKAPDVAVTKTTTQAILKDELFRMSKLNLGTVAPDFRGIEVDQKISSLSDYKGKITILFFWHALMPAHDETLELFRKYQEEFAGQDIQIIGVNMDNPLTLRRHIADANVTWRNFSDSTQTISKLYRIESWPAVYVLDEVQRIRYSGEPGAFVKITALDLAQQLAARKKALLEKAGE